MQQPKEQPMTARKLYREIIGLREELFTERSRMIRLESRTQKLATQILALARPAAGGNSNGNIDELTQVCEDVGPDNCSYARPDRAAGKNQHGGQTRKAGLGTVG